MRVRSLLTLSIVLLIVAAFQSCKSPNAPAPPAPTLTLILPDSAHAYDTLTLRAHYSDSIKSTWLFAWQFGDSTKASTRDTFVSHIYDSAGTYTVQVALTDTAAHQTIAKQTGQIKIMPLNGPMLTLTVPDTNYWGDSCVMSVSSSQPLKAGWKYSWSLGDSTNVTGTDFVLHYYLTPGIYYVIVNLNDTVRHIWLASKIVAVPVVARHFNLALLQSMPYVDFTWQSRMDTTYSARWNYGLWDDCGSAPAIVPLTWNGTNFSMGSNYSTSHTVVYNYNNGDWDAESGNDTLSGMVDMNSSQIITFSQNINYTMQAMDTENGMIAGGCWTTADTAYSALAVPFISESDTDIVFEANGDLVKNASYSYFLQDYDRVVGDQSFSAVANFADPTVNRYIRIRFHK